jgi:hypothetical protein
MIAAVAVVCLLAWAALLLRARLQRRERQREQLAQLDALFQEAKRERARGGA